MVENNTQVVRGPLARGLHDVLLGALRFSVRDPPDGDESPLHQRPPPTKARRFLHDHDMVMDLMTSHSSPRVFKASE